MPVSQHSKSTDRVSYWEHLLLLLAIVVFMLAYELLPKRKMTVIPASHADLSLYSDKLDGGLSEAQWVSKDTNHMACTVFEDDTDGYCGMVYIGWSDTKGFDLSDFNTIDVELETTGLPDEVRVYMRNYNVAYSFFGDSLSYLYNYVILGAEDLNGPIKIDLREFRIADWWIDRYKPPRHLQRPQFDSVVYIGFDMKTRRSGDYSLNIKNMTFSGELVQRSNWYLMALALVVLGVIFQAVRSALKARSQSKKDREMMEQMRAIQTTLIHQNEEIAKLSKVDPLTQVYNRLGFDTILDALKKEKMPEDGAVLLADIDHFKSINDKYGHAVGDKVIVYVASMLCQSIRDSDNVIRWGGEEFLVILPNCPQERAWAIAEQIRKSVADTPSDLSYTGVTVSIGGAPFKMTDEFDETFKKADKALYEAKNQGRNSVVISDPDN